MHILPIAVRELSVAARRPRTYRSRWLTALVAMGFTGYFLWLFAHFPGVTGASRRIFEMLVQFAFVYCLFIGVGSTADSLSSEKREGTMGLLFLTRLRSSDIVIGKLLATSLLTVYGIVATVPVLGICLLLGGVQAGEFWRVVLALLNTLFLSLSVGLLVSSLSHQERRATQTASGIMVVFGFVLPALGEYLQVKAQAIEWGAFLKTLSPAQTLDFGTRPITRINYFWWSVLVIQLLAWSALALSCCILPRSWQDNPAPAQQLSWCERWRQLFLGNPSRRTQHRHRLDRNPFYWLATRANYLVIETWLLLGGIALLAIWAGYFFRATLPVFVTCMITAVTLHAVIKMQVCAAACERLGEDKQTGTLEVLLATPLRVRDILRGQWLALLCQLGPPVAAVMFASFFMFLFAALMHEPDFFQDANAIVNYGLFCAAAVVMLVADAMALGWVGMWQAVDSKQLVQARSRTVSRVLIFPWIILILMTSLMVIYRTKEAGALSLLALWFFLGLVNNIFFALRARGRLYRDFRVAATERFQPSPASHGWWQRLPTRSGEPGSVASASVPMAGNV